VVVHSADDGRAIFVVPRGAFTYIGTTDTDCDEPPENIGVDFEDVSYLLGAVNEIFEDVRLSVKDVLSVWAGLRPLVCDAGARRPYPGTTRSTSRELALTVVGGKLTTHRSMAEAVVDEILTRFFPESTHRFGECRTTRMPLPGGRISDFPSYAEAVIRGAGDRWGLTSRMVERLLRNYGTDYLKILALGLSRRELLEPLSSDSLVLKGEVVYAVEDEMAMTLEDFMERRTDLAHFDRDRGMSVAQEVARLMGDCLGWEETVIKRQLDRYRHEVTSHVAPGSGRVSVS
jgi:glycerol-3-phosphate dehydrogenase